MAPVCILCLLLVSGGDSAVEEARALLLSGRPGQALQALGGAGAEADPVAVQFLAAQAWMALGQFDRAAALLGALARAHPELLRVRLDLAASLYALGQDVQAEQLFRAIHAGELPGAIRLNVEYFLERILQRRRLVVDWELSSWYDDNVNNGASETEVFYSPLFANLDGPFRLSPEAQAQSSWVVSTAARLRYRSVPRGAWYVEVGGHARRNWALQQGRYHRSTLGVQLGPRRYWAGGLGGVDMGVEQRLQGGDHYYTRPWLAVHVRHAPGRRWSVALRLSLWQNFYEGAVEDALGRSAQLTVYRGVGPGQLWLGAELARELTNSPVYSWEQHGLRLGYGGRFRGWQLRLEGAVSRTRYQGVNLFESTAPRMARRGTWQMSLAHRALRWRGFMPMLSVGGGITNSNIDIYDRRHPVLRMDVVRVF